MRLETHPLSCWGSGRRNVVDHPCGWGFCRYTDIVVAINLVVENFHALLFHSMCQGLDTIRCYRNSSLNLHVFISDVIPGSGCQGVHCCPAGLAIPSGGSSKDSCKSTQNRNLEHYIWTILCDDKDIQKLKVNSYSIYPIITFTMHGAGWEWNTTILWHTSPQE